MFNRTRKVARKFGAAASAAVLASPAFAQGTTMTDILDAVDLSGISGPVGAAALIVVGIALLFKGPAIAKRIISKV